MNFIFKNQKQLLHTINANIIKGTNFICSSTKQKIKQFAITIRKDASSQISQSKLIISQLKEKLLSQSMLKFKSSKIELDNIEKNIVNMSPENVLKRGYSITLLNGKAVKNISQVSSGDTLDTTVFEGSIISIVKSTNKTSNQ